MGKPICIWHSFNTLVSVMFKSEFCSFSATPLIVRAQYKMNQTNIPFDNEITKGWGWVPDTVLEIVNIYRISNELSFITKFIT